MKDILNKHGLECTEDSRSLIELYTKLYSCVSVEMPPMKIPKLYEAASPRNSTQIPSSTYKSKTKASARQPSRVPLQASTLPITSVPQEASVSSRLQDTTSVQFQPTTQFQPTPQLQYTPPFQPTPHFQSTPRISVHSNQTTNSMGWLYLNLESNTQGSHETDFNDAHGKTS